MGIILYISALFILSIIGPVICLLIHTRAFIKIRTKTGMETVSYMDYKQGEVSEAYVSGGGTARAIGRVGVTDKDASAHVEVLTSDYDDDSVKALYVHYGYIKEDGWIYRQLTPKSRPVRIGYTAKPSDPNTPTLEGQPIGLFHTQTKLVAYLGRPQANTKKQPVAIVECQGGRTDDTNPFTLESRACAFALFYHLYNKNNYQEYYKTQPYGWKDTALLATIVYCVLFLVYALVDTLAGKYSGGPLLNGSSAYYALLAAYFAIWALVRQIKIMSIEQSQSIQPVLDMLNKSLGNKAIDWTIMIMAALAVTFIRKLYSVDYTPMAIAIIIGMATNMSLKRNSKRWDIASSLMEDDGEQTLEDDEEQLNPVGDIVRTYEWDLDAECTDVRAHGSLSLYFTLRELTELRRTNPFYLQRSEKTDKEAVEAMFTFLTEHRGLNARLKYIVSQINRIAEECNLNETDKMQFTLDFVQEPNITYMLNRNSQSILKNEAYIRFPDETLYDKEGDCNSKALLAAMLFHLMKYNVLYMYSRTQQHAAIGIQFTRDKLIEIVGTTAADSLLMTVDGKQYIFCETTGDRFRLGVMAEGMKAEAFDQYVLLPYRSDLYPAEETETRIYNWDLDSASGTLLHGTLTIDLNREEINEMRNSNPFRTYGADSQTYADKARQILTYATQYETRSEAVIQIADYIRKEAERKHLTLLDTLQFALDFVQEPNITYRVDAESAGISYAKEYMRYPDEVLYDKEGDCDCKSSLTAALFHALGHNVVIMLSEKKAHAAIGVECRPEWLSVIRHNHPDIQEAKILREYNGRKYIYCETTGDGFRIGDITDTASIMDFETIVELPAEN